MGASSNIEEPGVPPPRDPTAFSPIFVLAPARSNSSVVTAMLGQHPGLCVFPELALFRRGTVGDLLADPLGWKGVSARLRIAGVFRALAEHAGGQTPERIVEAERWLEDRRAWPVAYLFDHLLALAAPRAGIEKSPESTTRPEHLARMDAAYPRARYLHLTRHPVPTVASMVVAWSGGGFWSLDPELFHQFCLGVWFHQHSRIDRFVAGLPPGRALRVRSEDVLNDPEGTLPEICRALGIDDGPDAVAEMLHPERSPYARLGPEGALGGFDPGFMDSPALRPAVVPDELALPRDWFVDPWLELAAMELATRFGYGGGGRR